MSFVYTLTAEGASDYMLLPVINWVLGRLTARAFSGRMANAAAFQDKSRDVGTRIAQSLRYYPCEILFVHRDSDTNPLAARVDEIVNACAEQQGRFVPVVPVRMTEAWFLFDEAAIRAAADRPRGRAQLGLPSLPEAERKADPKRFLEEILVRASEASGRRLKNFKAELSGRKRIVAERIDDFAPLLRLPSFAAFYEATHFALEESGLT